MGIIGLIPARGGSKRLPGKNIKPIAGKPLIAYTIEAALKASSLSKVIVSTDDEEIKKIAIAYGAEVPFMRPEELSGDDVSDLPVLKHALEFFLENNHPIDAIAYLRPTSPLKTADIINKVVEKYQQTNAEVVRTLTPAEGVYHPYWMFSKNKNGRIKSFIDKIKLSDYYQSQRLPPAYRIAGLVDLFSAQSIITEDIFDNTDTFSVTIESTIAIDIDTPADFHLCEQLIEAISK